MKRAVWATQVFPRYPTDLLGGFLLRLARELPSRGWQVTVVAPGAPGLPPAERFDGVSVVRFAYRGMDGAEVAYRGQMHVRAARHPLAFASFLRSFREAIGDAVHRTDPVLLHAHWWIPTAWLAAGCARRAGLPLLVSVHGTDMRLLRGVPPLRPVAHRVLGGASLVLPVSRALDREVAGLGIPDARRVVLPMPADPERFGRVYSPEPRPRQPRLLVVARLTRQKCVDQAIAAVRDLTAGGTDVHLDVVGDGPERRALERFADASGVASRVTFHGLLEADRLAPLYRRSRALLMPARDEGYGLVIVEAALSGVPTIGLRSGGIPDLVRDGETGLLVEPGDRIAWARSVRRLLEEPGLADRLGGNARQEAAARTAAPLADRLVRLYDEVASARHRGAHGRPVTPRSSPGKHLSGGPT